MNTKKMDKGTLKSLTISALLLSLSSISYAGEHDDHDHHEYSPEPYQRDTHNHNDHKHDYADKTNVDNHRHANSEHGNKDEEHEGDSHDSGHDHEAEHDHEEEESEEDQHDDHAHEHDDDNHSDGGEHEEGVVEIPEAMAAESGITVAPADSGEINKTLTVYGRVVADPGRTSHIRARFPGTITRVDVNIGERVEKGQPLAEVESNESLKRYVLKAPFAGIITARHATQGELTEEQALFTVANFDLVWAEFKVFPGQINRIALGQAVSVTVESEQAFSTIKYMIPSASGQPFVIARAPIDNRQGRWTPGLLLQGQVVVDKAGVALRVDNRALQLFENQRVVFVKQGDRYESRPLQLGRGDSRFTEVVGGLDKGEEYVVNNSYLIKADLEKSGAAHEH